MRQSLVIYCNGMWLYLVIDCNIWGRLSVVIDCNNVWWSLVIDCSSIWLILDIDCNSFINNSFSHSQEKEAVATNKEVTDLASRLQSLEFSYKQLEKITLEVKTSANEWKNKYMDAKTSADGLKSRQ